MKSITVKLIKNKCKAHYFLQLLPEIIKIKVFVLKLKMNDLVCITAEGNLHYS